MNRPTIAHVLHRLDRAGAEVLAADLARRLRDRYRFVFLCLDGLGPLAHELSAEGFRVIDLRRRPGVDGRLVLRMRRATAELKIDLLHAHQYTPFFYAAAGRALGRALPLLFTEHGRHQPDCRRARRVWANRVLLRRQDRVTAVAGWVRQALIDHEGLPADRIEVVPNGIDPARFAHGDAAAARRAMGVCREEQVVLQVGRFAEVKDHLTAIRGFAELTARVNGVRLVLVGDGPLRPQIEAEIARLKLGGRVRLLGLRDDVPQLLAGADVVQLTSRSEGMPVTLLEAMAAGRAIAATAVGGNLELIDHDRTGLLCLPGDPASLAANLARLLGDPALRQRLGQAGRDRLLRRYTQQRMHQNYQNLYDQQLAAATPPPIGRHLLYGEQGLRAAGSRL